MRRKKLFQSMKKICSLFLLAFLSMFAFLSMPVFADGGDSLLRFTQTWGSWGEGAEDVDLPTSQTTYFYDNQNRLVASLQERYWSGDDESTVEEEYYGSTSPKYFYFYTYNDDGLLTETSRFSYGQNDGYLQCWETESSLTQSNEYDDEGNLVYSNNYSSGRIVYKWDGKNLVEEVDSSVAVYFGTIKWSKTIVYSDFLEGVDNCPQTMTSLSTYGSMYLGQYAYDDQNRVVSYVEWEITSADVDDDHHLSNITLADYPESKTEYTYDDQGLCTKLVSNWSSSAGDYVSYSRTEETLDDDGGIRSVSYIYYSDDDLWMAFTSPIVSYYAQFPGDSAPDDFTIAQVSDKINTVSLSATIPETANGEETWKVYRNGEYVGDATLDENQLSFVDADLKNAEYVYFIQASTAETDSLTLGNSAAFNCTTPVDITVIEPLEAPQNPRIESNTTSGSGSNKTYTVVVAWDEPDVPDGITLQGYNIYLNPPEDLSSTTPENGTTVISETSYTLTWTDIIDECFLVMVEAVYETYGRAAIDEPLAVKLGGAGSELPFKAAVVDTLGNEAYVASFYYNPSLQLARVFVEKRLDGDNPYTKDVEEQDGDYEPLAYILYTYADEAVSEKQTMYYGRYAGYSMAWTAPEELEVGELSTDSLFTECFTLAGVDVAETDSVALETREYYTGVSPINFKKTIVEDEVNTVDLAAFQTYETFGDPTFQLYRNGVYVGDATYTSSNYKIAITDALVPNGTWDYFVLSDVVTSNVAIPITVPLTIEFATELSPATNLRAVSTIVGEETYYLSLEWDAPETELEILGYNIYSDVGDEAYPLPDNGADSFTAAEYTYEWAVADGASTKEVIVESVYSIGTAKTEAVTFNLLEEEEETGISSIADGGEGERLLSVYDESGRKLHVSNLKVLSPGIYIVTTRNADGGQKVQKILIR